MTQAIASLVEAIAHPMLPMLASSFDDELVLKIVSFLF